MQIKIRMKESVLEPYAFVIIPNTGGGGGGGSSLCLEITPTHSLLCTKWNLPLITNY